jgi:hypothetical protein
VGVHDKGNFSSRGWKVKERETRRVWGHVLPFKGTPSKTRRPPSRPHLSKVLPPSSNTMLRTKHGLQGTFKIQTIATAPKFSSTNLLSDNSPVVTFVVMTFF